MVKAFKEVYEGGDFSLPLISQLKGKTFVITDVKFYEGKFGEYAVITVNEGDRYRTSNMVILKQLHEIESYIKSGGVQVKLSKIKNYYTFE